LDDPVENLPNLKKYLERFEALPQIAAHMAKIEYIGRPYNGPSAIYGGD